MYINKNMKKYIYINIAAIIISLFSIQNAFAFDIDTGTSTSSCQNTNVNATATNIVSELDLSGTIYLCVNVGSNGPLTITTESQLSGYSSTTVVNDSNSNYAIFYTFSTTTLQNIGHDVITFSGVDNHGNNVIESATLYVNLEVKPLSMTNVKIDAGGGTGNPVALNGSILYGEGINYTCNNATEMYIESQPAGSTFSTSYFPFFEGVLGVV